MLNPKAFTLVEIIVATVILSLVVLGMLGVFLAGNRHVIHTRERMTSAELGKLFIDPLSVDVNSNIWLLGPAGNALATGITYCDSDGAHTQNRNCPPVAQRRVNNRVFTARYTTTALADNTASLDDNIRRVTTLINWNEPISQ